MHHYSLFGGTLRSELPMPDFAPCDAAPATWTFRRNGTHRAPLACELLGSASTPGCAVALLRTDAGMRLRHRCSGQYDIVAGGSEIFWHPARNPLPEYPQADLIARVMPIALHASGGFCLHGSAVAMGGAGVGFVADSGVGKSTLAVAMTNAGAPMVSDDILTIDAARGGCTLRPGFAKPRLRRDSARALLRDEQSFSVHADGKHVIDDLADECLVVHESVPLSAVYVLRPVRPEGEPPAAHRIALSPSAAAIALIRYSKAGMLLGGSEAGIVLHRAAAIAARVPVYELHLVRDLARLDEVVGQLFEWHAAGALALTR